MTQPYTMYEAIRRYGEFMRNLGELKEKSRVVESANIYTEFTSSLIILDHINTYR